MLIHFAIISQSFTKTAHAGKPHSFKDLFASSRANSKYSISVIILYSRI